jgi:hypothetical protein
MWLPSRRVLAFLACALGACSTPPEPTGVQRTCDKDIECGSKQYCTVARLCRTDCYTDSDCLGPTTTAQCNTHGRCIDTVDSSDAAPPDEDASKTDGKPSLDGASTVDGDGIDAFDGGAGGGGP